MRSTLPLAVLAIVAGCGLLPSITPPPGSVEDARSHLDAIIESGIARDFDRMCDLAGTPICTDLLDGSEHLAPDAAPDVVDVSVHQPTPVGEGFATGGVLFLLCGLDAAGDAFESEVLVSRAQSGEFHVVSSVWWRGSTVDLDGQDGGAEVGGPPREGRCP
jgi:hypothetical protein